MKQYKWYIAMFGIIVILIIALNVSLHRIKVLKANEGKTIRDTTIVVKLDTVKIIKPIYISQKVVDTLLMPIKDTLRINDTLYQAVPTTQKYYAKDSLYRAWVSGYRPNLDSIQIFPKTVYSTITNTIYKKPAKVGVGLMVGYGMVFGQKVELRPFLGAGVFYKF